MWFRRANLLSSVTLKNKTAIRLEHKVFRFLSAGNAICLSIDLKIESQSKISFFSVPKLLNEKVFVYTLLLSWLVEENRKQITTLTNQSFWEEQLKLSNYSLDDSNCSSFDLEHLKKIVFKFIGFKNNLLIQWSTPTCLIRIKFDQDLLVTFAKLTKNAILLYTFLIWHALFSSLCGLQLATHHHHHFDFKTNKCALANNCCRLIDRDPRDYVSFALFSQ